MSELYKELFKITLGILAMIPGVRLLMIAIYRLGLRYMVWERGLAFRKGCYKQYKQLYHSTIAFTIARIKKVQGITKAS